MKYFLIAGEASGDIHGANLLKEIRKIDKDANFECFGGDLMEAQGAKIIKHYKELAFMGFIPVLLNLKTIFINLALCKQCIKAYQPDVLILIDYPGFNLKIAKYIKKHTTIPVYYYISPKVWAWKEYRVKWFKKYVDEMFCILPFEIDFFKKHNYKVHYVGNPTVDEVTEYKVLHKGDTLVDFAKEYNLDHTKPIVALLAGSRQHEIKDNLPAMLEVVQSFADIQIVLACAPNIDASFYRDIIQEQQCTLVFNETYRVLSHANIALVTSGTATLETALFDVPQVVCYKTILPCLVTWYFKHMMNTPYISLVNLIANKTIVQEMFAAKFSIISIKKEVNKLLFDQRYIANMKESYLSMQNTLGSTGASRKAAEDIVTLLKDTNS